MKWQIVFIEAAQKDLAHLDGSTRAIVLKLIKRVSENPLAKDGYGKPLGSLSASDLSGYYKIKIKRPPLRIIYRCEEVNNIMRIIIIGIRTKDEVCKQALRRIAKL